MNEYTFSEIQVGLSHSFSVKIIPKMVSRFLEISGDNNPLHTDNDYARQKGFSGKVVHGLLTSSFYSTLIGVYLPGKYCILHNIEAKFPKAVYLNDILLITGTVIYANQLLNRVEIKAKIENQHSKIVSMAKINVGLFEKRKN